MTEQTLQTHLHAAIRHPTEPRILLLPGDEGWHLPYAQPPNDFWLANVEVVNKAIRELLNAGVWSLRQVHYVEDEEQKRIEAIYEMELLDLNWQPPDGARWVSAADFAAAEFAGTDFAGLQIANADHIPLLSAYLTTLEQGVVPDQRPAWARPGWVHEARAWVETELARHGYALRELEQLKQWGISSVLRAKTDYSDFYFKTTNPLMALFVNEASVTQCLSELFPAYVPTPLSVDISRDWMLLPAFDQLFQRETTLEVKAEAFRRFARLQIETIDKLDALLAAGCLDRRIEVMISQIDPLLDDPAATHLLPSEQTAELRALVPRIKELSQKLSAFGLPHTLVHGDLHLGNAALVNGQTIYFDWTDACIAHPFIDLHSLAWVKDETARETILTSYLEPWTDFAPMPRLREIWRLAYALLPLHHSVSYQYIVNNLEPDSKGELDVAYKFLVKLLERVKDYLLKVEG